jgi:3-oxoacyl-[acyl-carrier protein] reductase
MRNLRDKRVLLTGGASGIGRALTIAFAREGAHVFALDIDTAGLSETVLAARKFGVEAYGRHCDVSEAENITSSTQAVLRHWGTIDVLVNNAGVCYYGPTTSMTSEQWDSVMAINLQAPIRFTQQLLPTLLKQEEAHVLNVASFYGFLTTARATAYHVSKFGLIGLSESLRTEFGRHGLGVTALCPGYVRTNLFDNMMHDEGRTAPQPPRWFSTTPEVVARKAIRGVRRNQRLVLVTPLAYVAYYLKRFVPGLLDWGSHLGRRKTLRKRRLRLAEEHSHAAAVPFSTVAPESSRERAA